LLLGQASGLVARLVVVDDIQFIFIVAATPLPPQPAPAHYPQRPTYLLQSELRIFFSSTDPCPRRRTPLLPGTGTGVAATLCSSFPRNPGSPDPTWPGGNCARSSSHIALQARGWVARPH